MITTQKPNPPVCIYIADNYLPPNPNFQGCKEKGCGTCIGGFTKQTVFAISRINPATITGGSERYVIDISGNKLKDAHEDGSNHYSGEAFDTGLGDLRVKSLIADESKLGDLDFFNAYGLTKDSIDCKKHPLNSAIKTHYHCDVTQGNVDSILNCDVGYNRWTIEN